MKNYYKQELGRQGERFAAEFLEKEGYEILDKNYSCAFGEIDVIATKDEDIIFVEVKTRSQLEFGYPSEAVDARKQKHIYKVAESYLYKTKMWRRPISFDVIEVYIEDDDYKIAHIKNAIIENPIETYRRRNARI